MHNAPTGAFSKRAWSDPVHHADQLRPNLDAPYQGPDDLATSRHLARFQAFTHLPCELLQASHQQTQFPYVIVSFRHRLRLLLLPTQTQSGRLNALMKWPFFQVTFLVHLQQAGDPPARLADLLLE